MDKFKQNHFYNLLELEEHTHVSLKNQEYIQINDKHEKWLSWVHSTDVD